MKIIRKNKKVCPYCMEEHDVVTVRNLEQVVFKGKKVNYIATYEYCENTDEYWATEDLIAENYVTLKNVYAIANKQEESR